MKDLERRCTAKVSDGSRRCRNKAILGGSVCKVHGGSAPQVQRAARERLAALVDPAIDGLRKAFEKGDIGETIKAARLVLDRTGYGPTSKVEIVETVKQEEFGRVLRALQKAGVTPEQISVARSILEAEDAGGDESVH